MTNTIEEALKRFREKFPHGVYHLHISNGKVTNDPDEKRERGIAVSITDQIEKLFTKELTAIATKSAEEERSRIDKIMIQFEKTNTKRNDLIAGWYWLRSKLREVPAHKE